MKVGQTTQVDGATGDATQAPGKTEQTPPGKVEAGGPAADGLAALKPALESLTQALQGVTELLSKSAVAGVSGGGAPGKTEQTPPVKQDDTHVAGEHGDATQAPGKTEQTPPGKVEGATGGGDTALAGVDALKPALEQLSQAIEAITKLLSSSVGGVNGGGPGGKVDQHGKVGQHGGCGDDMDMPELPDETGYLPDDKTTNDDELDSDMPLPPGAEDHEDDTEVEAAGGPGQKGGKGEVDGEEGPGQKPGQKGEVEGDQGPGQGVEQGKAHGRHKHHHKHDVDGEKGPGQKPGQKGEVDGEKGDPEQSPEQAPMKHTEVEAESGPPAKKA